SSMNIPTATVSLRTPSGEYVQTAKSGQGSVEALYGALEELVSEEPEVSDYQLSSVGRGTDALAEARVQLHINEQLVSGRGSAQDVIEASASAYLNAVNRYIIQKTTKAKQKIES